MWYKFSKEVLISAREWIFLWKEKLELIIWICIVFMYSYLTISITFYICYRCICKVSYYIYYELASNFIKCFNDLQTKFVTVLTEVYCVLTLLWSMTLAHIFCLLFCLNGQFLFDMAKNNLESHVKKHNICWHSI